MSQFPSGFQGGALPGFSAAAAPAATFTNFRPQYSVPGQPASSNSQSVSIIVFVNNIYHLYSCTNLLIYCCSKHDTEVGSIG